MKKTMLCIVSVVCVLISNAQNTGIGTTTPVARLHVTDSNVVFTGPLTLDASTLYAPPIQGPGSRMMWYPQKAAFRAGIVDGTHWDKDNIGSYSFAVGFNSTAIGEGSFATGLRSTASGVGSTALGRSTSSGNYSTAAGLSLANGAFAFAGGNSYAQASYSTAFGEDNYARAYGGFAFGVRNDNSDNPNPDAPHPSDRLFQIGNGSFSIRSTALTVLRNGNVGIGNLLPRHLLSFSNTVGDKIGLYGEAGPHFGFGIQSSLLQIHADFQSSSVAIGYGSSAAFTENFRVSGNGNVSLGMSTADATLTFGQSLSKKIILFHGGSGGEAGFGVFPNELRIQSDYSGAAVTFGYDNAGTSFIENMRIEGNGNLQVRGTVFANSAFYSSDSRYKTNISAISNGLDKILQLNAYHFYWKDVTIDAALQTGLIAQEVQQVFPELVRDNKGSLTVNYVGLIPYLIESIKELKKENEELKKMKMEWTEMKMKMEKLLSK